jgi:hypothetical protein
MSNTGQQRDAVAILIARLRRSEEEAAQYPHLAFWSKFISQIEYVPWGRNIENTARTEAGAIVDAHGENIPAVLHEWYSNGDDRFTVVAKAVDVLMGGPTAVRTPIEPSDRSQTSVRLMARNIADVLDGFYLSEVGSGVAQAMALTMRVLVANPGSVVLIEEPERGLHSGAQRRLARLLAEHAEETDKQLVFATHSPAFSDPLQDRSSAYLLTMDENGYTKARNLAQVSIETRKWELGISAADLAGYDALILWDGQSEQLALPPVMDELWHQASESTNGLKTLCMHGDPQTRHNEVAAVAEALEDSGTILYVMCDDDEGVRERLQRLEGDGLLSDGNWVIWKPMGCRHSDATGEFEDNFEPEQLISAANAQATEAGQTEQLDVSVFEDRLRNDARKTSKVLEKYYYEVFCHGLDKPDLNFRLGQSVVQQIEQGGDILEQYEFTRFLAGILERLTQSA